MMSDVIGDVDPEDAWDDGDPLDDKLFVLDRVVASLRAHRDERFAFRRGDALRLVAKLERDEVDHPRLAELRDALENLA